jgi:hypothetical protein
MAVQPVVNPRLLNFLDLVTVPNRVKIAWVIRNPPYPTHALPMVMTRGPPGQLVTVIGLNLELGREKVEPF